MAIVVDHWVSVPEAHWANYAGGLTPVEYQRIRNEALGTATGPVVLFWIASGQWPTQAATYIKHRPEGWPVYVRSPAVYTRARTFQGYGC